MIRDLGIAQTMSLAMDRRGEQRDTGRRRASWCGRVGLQQRHVGSRGAELFQRPIFNTVAGLATNVSTTVLCCSAFLFANSNASRFDQRRPHRRCRGDREQPGGAVGGGVREERLIGLAGQIAHQPVADDPAKRRGTVQRQFVGDHGQAGQLARHNI